MYATARRKTFTLVPPTTSQADSITERKCTNHQIRTVILRELALDATKSVIDFVKINEAEFIKQVRETSAVKQEEAAKSRKKQIAKEQKWIAELNTLNP